MCMIECPTGFKQDDRGCNLCECNPEMEVYVDKCAVSVPHVVLYKCTD